MRSGLYCIPLRANPGASVSQTNIAPALLLARLRPRAVRHVLAEEGISTARGGFHCTNQVGHKYETMTAHLDASGHVLAKCHPVTKSRAETFTQEASITFL